MEKKTVITEEEKVAIRGGLTHALERTIQLCKNPKRALDEGYGVLRGFYNALWLMYTVEAVEDGMEYEIQGIWEVFKQRAKERR